MKTLQIFTERLVLVERLMKVSELKKNLRIHTVNQKEGFTGMLHVHIPLFKVKDFIAYPKKLSEKLNMELRLVK